MKLEIQRIVCVLVVIFVVQVNQGQVRWFDQYSKVTDVEEKLHLDDFAYYLMKNPNFLGYIAFRVGKNDKKSVVKKRAERNKRYLIQEFRSLRNRIYVIYLGNADDTNFILQPLDRGKPFPR